MLFFLIHRYAFGSEGKPEFEIGPEDDVVYEVTLKDFQRVSATARAHIFSFGLCSNHEKEEIHPFSTTYPSPPG